MNKRFIPIYEYCKKYDVSKQNVYRWLRESKIPEEKHKVVEKVVKRIMIIDEDINPTK